MSNNDIFEMDSVTETEEMEDDNELGMIDEEVGKRFRKSSWFLVLVHRHRLDFIPVN